MIEVTHDTFKFTLAHLAVRRNNTRFRHQGLNICGGFFYGVDMEDAFEKFDGVRRAMAYKQLMNRETGKPFGKVTFSGGLARVTDFEDPHAAVGKADEALYQAKQTGRNRIEMAGFDGSSVSRT